MIAKILIENVKNLSKTQLALMKTSEFEIVNKLSRIYVYCGRTNKSFKLKVSPLANARIEDYDTIEECLKDYEKKLKRSIYELKKYKEELSFNPRPALEINHILKLCEKYNEIVLCCWCVENVEDDITPCHCRIVKQFLEEK